MVEASLQAWQRCRIAQLEEKLQVLESGRVVKEKADGTRGDDTSKLKTLISGWVNRKFKPDPPVNPDDKNSRGFTNNACGRLLCPAELDWSNLIRNHSDGYIVTDLSFPAFLYEKYTANPNDLEEGLFKGKILAPYGLKVKKHVAQIIGMEKVTPRSIAYISVDGDFDYVQFWWTVVDFFEKPPGREAQRVVNRLLEWWTRCAPYHLLCYQPLLQLHHLEKFSEGVTEKTLAMQRRPACL
ncbi:hypothetical protein BDR05DRAFT_894438 [Suillus weaverae]|nr:hypothetical protein BDR05DRAFT_894438 [Suillus weaverae]